MEFILEEPTEADGPIPEDTVVIGEVMSAAVKKKKAFTTQEEYERVEIRFQINDPESPFDGRSIYGETSTAFKRHEACRLYSWSQEILGSELPAGFQLNLDLLAGHQVRLVIGARHYEKDGEQRVYNFVADVMRSRQPSGANAAF